MTILQITFLIVALIAVVAALMVVTSPSMVHAALWLILTLGCVAVLFVLLNAGFLAVVQVAIYIDAIAIMIIIVVMLTRRAMSQDATQVTKTWWAAILVAATMFAALVLLFTLVPFIWEGPAALSMTGEAFLDELGESLVDVNRYILPFEVASILLLAALIGSISVALPLKIREKEGGD